MILLLLLNTISRTEFLYDLAANLFPTSEKESVGSVEGKGAMLGAIFAFLCFSSIHPPNTIILRPHPIFWRVVLGAFSIYALIMTYLFLLPLNQVQQHLRVFDD